jgi:hypothetical protein
VGATALWVDAKLVSCRVGDKTVRPGWVGRYVRFEHLDPSQTVTIEFPMEERTESCSPLAIPIVDKVVPHDLLRPAVPTKALADIVKERLPGKAKYLVLKYLKMGFIELGHIV